MLSANVCTTAVIIYFVKVIIVSHMHARIVVLELLHARHLAQD